MTQRQDAREPEAPRRDDFVWVEDEVPSGAVVQPAAVRNVAWDWVSGPSIRASGGIRSVKVTATGLGQVVFEKGRSRGYAVEPGTNCLPRSTSIRSVRRRK